MTPLRFPPLRRSPVLTIAAPPIEPTPTDPVTVRSPPLTSAGLPIEATPEGAGR
jgi:hypothetical protein